MKSGGKKNRVINQPVLVVLFLVVQVLWVALIILGKAYYVIFADDLFLFTSFAVEKKNFSRYIVICMALSYYSFPVMDPYIHTKIQSYEIIM